MPDPGERPCHPAGAVTIPGMSGLQIKGVFVPGSGVLLTSVEETGTVKIGIDRNLYGQS